jgi:hypothetical protein
MHLVEHLKDIHTLAVIPWTPPAEQKTCADNERAAAYVGDASSYSDETIGEQMPETSAAIALRPLQAACLRLSDFADPEPNSNDGSDAGLSARDEMLMGIERAALYTVDTYSAGLMECRLHQADVRDHFGASVLTLAILSTLQDPHSVKTVAHIPVDMDV